MGRYAKIKKGTCHGRKFGYLLFIARKYGFPPSKFFQGLLDACRDGFFHSGELHIERCAEDEEYANVRVKFRGQIIAQTRLKLDILHSKRDWTYYDAFIPRSAASRRENQTLRICDLSVGMRNVTLTATVARRPVVRHIISRFTSVPLRLASVAVADDTGEIKLLLVSKEHASEFPNLVKGTVLKIDKGYVRDYLGAKQLRIRSGVGKITIATPSLVTS